MNDTGTGDGLWVQGLTTFGVASSQGETVLKFGMILAGALMLGCAATAPRDWKQVNDGMLSFYGPSSLRPTLAMSIDSYFVQYAAPGLRIDFTSETVYGNQCTGPDTVRAIVTGRTPRGVSCRESLRYCARLSLCSPRRKEFLGNAYCRTKKDRANAVRILESVVIRKTPRP